MYSVGECERTTQTKLKRCLNNIIKSRSKAYHDRREQTQWDGDFSKSHSDY